MATLVARLGRLHGIQTRLDGNQIKANRSANGPEEEREEDEEGQAVDEVHHVAAEEGAAGIEGVVEGSALGGGVAQLGLHGGATAGQVGLQAVGMRDESRENMFQEVRKKNKYLNKYFKSLCCCIRFPLNLCLNIYSLSTK